MKLTDLLQTIDLEKVVVNVLDFDKNFGIYQKVCDGWNLMHFPAKTERRRKMRERTVKNISPVITGEGVEINVILEV